MNYETPFGMDDPHRLWELDIPGLHIGTQRFTTSEDDLNFLNRHGVSYMALNTMPVDRDIGWDVDWLMGEKDKCEK